MEIFSNADKYYMGIKDFKIPQISYASSNSVKLKHDSLELSNLKNYSNAENKFKKLVPVIAFCGAALLGGKAFLSSKTGEKLINSLKTQVKLERFNNFDTSRVLEHIPDDKTLEQELNSIIGKVTLEPVFDENKVTADDIEKLIIDNGESIGIWKWDLDGIVKDIANDSGKKHLFNNILSVCKDEKTGKINPISHFYFSEIFDAYQKTNYSNDKIDKAFKLCKLSNNDLYETSKFINNLDTNLKITSLNEYIKKNYSKIADNTNLLRLNTTTNTNFNDYVNFIVSLRKGNIDGYLYIGNNFDFKTAGKFLNSLNDRAIRLINLNNIDKIFDNKTLSPKALSKKLNSLSEEKIKQIYLSNLDFNTFFDFEDFINIKNINQLDMHGKKKLMQTLVRNNTDAFKSNSELFPILPRSKDEYCSLLQKLSKSIGINTKALTKEQIVDFEKTINSIASTIQDIDFNQATLSLKMSREEFVSKIQDKISSLDSAEQHKVMDYFGFEIKEGKLTGYPINVNNGEKLSEIEKGQTKKVIEAIRPIVEEFSSSSNKIKVEGCVNATAFEQDLNKLFETFPELRSIIGRKQHGTHAYTLDKHTFKVLQEVCQNPKFSELNSSDKKVLQISALLHDITKVESQRDYSHPANSAFDAYYIIQKLNLSETDQLKVYELIKTHNWLQMLDDNRKSDMFNNIAQDFAFDSRHTNTFELAKILCEADLKSVKSDDSYFKAFKGDMEKMGSIIDEYINKLHKTQIILPQTRIPKASEIINGEIKSANGIKNTVVYLNKADNDLSKYGFDKNTTKDNFLALVHALDNEEQLAKFDTFSTIDTEALLSTSYIKADDYKVFRKQGLILDTAFDDIHAGYFKDFGTGYGKGIELLKEDYLFYGNRKNILPDDGWRSDRTHYRSYISSLIKKQLGLDDMGYMEKLEKIKDCKSITDIEKVDKDFADGLLEVFKNMQSGKRNAGRAYNEMLVSRPKIQGVFAYDKKYEHIPEFLRKYAQDNNLPIIILGNK